ncbi:MAG: DEAD/DEAH box helicase domain protein [Candidatus Giovannonibacteria bacterium GW2011_GWA2_44_13b]|uniref:DEAD/DEAH box helicase domain protein n=1 Tax=Candidatus Giovannonibacteria bacterium GW2011_GWA2_44_13b TaxID=1618647 RepID=A0A0G1H0E6_9BACT|nr:MAG: DEAD/DEAH box helicase domain protein [Candidatus Giovannonibacteria bacterium GW2011_GWA2_44_13b]
MASYDVVFDIETKKSFDEVGGKAHFDKLGISVVGAHISGEDKYYAFEEREIPEFEKMIKGARCVIGFNIHHFDLPVLQPYVSWSLKSLKTLDLMEDVEKGAGFRISLDNLSETSLGARKSGDGLQALRWYKEGRIDDIKKYCLKDVELTKALWEYGKKNGHVLFYSKHSSGRVAIPVSWGKMEANLDAYSQTSLF